MSFTFVHAADVHLDSPLRGLERYEGAPAAKIRLATRVAFENLVQYCLDESVDFLLLAGDLYDGDWKDYNTGLFLLKQMTRLKEAKIPVFLVHGNHDAENAITKKLSPLDNMHVFPSRKPSTMRLEELNVSIHGQSYARKDVSEDLAAGYPQAESGSFNIGLLHTCADGRWSEHGRYAPCSIKTLEDRHYDYWALGHVHRRNVLRTEPHIVFPGNLQGRYVRETGPKGATVVRVDGGRAELEAHPFDVVRWEVCEVTVGAATTPDHAIDLVQEKLAQLRARTSDLVLAVRVVLTGTSRAHVPLVSNPERWTNEARVRGAALPDMWVESVQLETHAPVDLAALRAQLDNPLGEVLRTIDAMRGDEAALARLAELLKPMEERFPSDGLDLAGGVRLDQAESVRHLLHEVEQLLVPRLLAEEVEAS
jgi:DNA repair exonuclease SbcCD nuclease subunit